MQESGPFGYNPEIKKDIQEKAPLLKDIEPINSQLEKYGTGNEEYEDLLEQVEEGVNNVDLENGDLEKLKENGFKTSGYGSYLISPIGEGLWHSDRYFNCTAVVAIGRDKENGKEISFLSHQDPNYFIDGSSDKVEKFSQELKDSLEELKSKTEENTVEVIFLGGNYDNNYQGDDQYKNEHYKQSIEKLRGIVHDSLGFDPKVLTGPNNNIGSETVVIVETDKRKVWVERTNQPSEFDQSYMANSLDEKEAKWVQALK